MPPPTPFAGLVAIVTGGASGIGEATALRLAEQGAVVAALDRVERHDWPTSTDGGGRVQGVVADVTDQASVDRAVEGWVASCGGLDILVNNAGIGAAGRVEDNPDEEWHRVYDVNVLGIARTCRAAMPHLRASEVGVVVNTASVASWAGLPNRAVYSASKGAVLALTLAMAADELGRVRVSCVCPGTTDTPWVGRLLDAAADPAAERDALVARQPMRRLVTAAEVAEAICYLASPLAGSTTGTALAVDGGMWGVRPPR